MKLICKYFRFHLNVGDVTLSTTQLFQAFADLYHFTLGSVKLEPLNGSYLSDATSRFLSVPLKLAWQMEC